MEIDQSNFHNWKHDPVTIKFMEYLERRRKEINLLLVSYQKMVTEDRERLIGEKLGLEDSLFISFEDLEEGNNEDKSLRT